LQVLHHIRSAQSVSTAAGGGCLGAGMDIELLDSQALKYRPSTSLHLLSPERFDAAHPSAVLIRLSGAL
jgi:hypothetical protein